MCVGKVGVEGRGWWVVGGCQDAALHHKKVFPHLGDSQHGCYILHSSCAFI